MANQTGKADLVLHEGEVLGHPGSDSVAISSGRIVAYGSFPLLKAFVGSRTHLVKLAGRTVAPGFIDSHLHFLEAAAVATGLSVWRCRTVGDLLADLRLAAGKTPPGNWLRAFGCDETLIAEKRGPTREEFDQSVPKNPLRVRHQTLHASWLNSRAINQLGLENPKFRPPDGAQMIRDATGRLIGLFVGMEEWFSEHLPRVTAAEVESRARVLSRELAAAGVTAFTDATVRNGPDEVALFGKLVTSGSICQRTSVMVGASNLDSLKQSVEHARAGRIRIAGLKFMPGEERDDSTMARRTRIALGGGFDCAYHVTEVEELSQVLDAIELARRQFAIDLPLPFCRIEHGGTIPPDYIERIAATGAWVVTNPGFLHFRGAKYLEEPGLVPHLYRARSLKTAGIELAGATDAPVTPARPLAAIAAAISRSTVHEQVLAPEECLTSPEAFALFTRDAARLARLDAGEIESDKLADLIVLPRNPATMSPAELLSLTVDMTLIGGRIVYERGRPAIAYSNSADLHSA
ncbi:MAG: amidohydrolase [Candidatus Binataceae bacterium]